jgi:hypothetical protein
MVWEVRMGAKTAKPTIECKVRILCPLPEVYPKYQPIVGGVYDACYQKAQYGKGRQRCSPICFIKIRDKSICLKTDEYEILED